MDEIKNESGRRRSWFRRARAEEVDPADAVAAAVEAVPAPTLTTMPTAPAAPGRFAAIAQPEPGPELGPGLEPELELPAEPEQQPATGSRAEDAGAVDRPTGGFGGLVPVPKVERYDPRSRGRAPVGLALEKARKRIGFGPEAAAAEAGLQVHQLLDYESGMRTPPDDVIETLSEVYGLDPNRLDPDVGAQASADGLTLHVGFVTIDLAGLDNDEACHRIAASLRALRDLADDVRVSLRTEELPALATVLDLQDDGLVDALQRSFTAGNRVEATTLAELLHRAAGAQPSLPAAGSPAPDPID